MHGKRARSYLSDQLDDILELVARGGRGYMGCIWMPAHGNQASSVRPWLSVLAVVCDFIHQSGIIHERIDTDEVFSVDVRCMRLHDAGRENR